MDKEVGGRGSNRDKGQRCGKMVILLRKKNYLNGFGGIGWSSFLDTVNEKEGKRVIEAALLTLSAEEVEWDGGKTNRPVALVEV